VAPGLIVAQVIVMYWHLIGDHQIGRISTVGSSETQRVETLMANIELTGSEKELTIQEISPNYTPTF
jgi:hypothetical protein